MTTRIRRCHFCAEKWSENPGGGTEEGVVRFEVTVHSVAVDTIYACSPECVAKAAERAFQMVARTKEAQCLVSGEAAARIRTTMNRLARSISAKTEIIRLLDDAVSRWIETLDRDGEIGRIAVVEEMKRSLGQQV